MIPPRLRVLLVEDHDFTRDLIVNELRAIDPDLDIRAVAGVATARHELVSQGFTPDVVVLDLRLDGTAKRMGGLALVPLLDGAPIVLFTAEQSPPASVLALVAAHVVKGPPAAALAGVIRRVAAEDRNRNRRSRP